MTKEEVINLSLKTLSTDELIKMAKKSGGMQRAVIFKELCQRCGYPFA